MKPEIEQRLNEIALVIKSMDTFDTNFNLFVEVAKRLEVKNGNNVYVIEAALAPEEQNNNQRVINVSYKKKSFDNAYESSKAAIQYLTNINKYDTFVDILLGDMPELIKNMYNMSIDYTVDNSISIIN